MTSTQNPEAFASSLRSDNISTVHAGLARQLSNAVIARNEAEIKRLGALYTAVDAELQQRLTRPAINSTVVIAGQGKVGAIANVHNVTFPGDVTF